MVIPTPGMTNPRGGNEHPEGREDFPDAGKLIPRRAMSALGYGTAFTIGGN